MDKAHEMTNGHRTNFKIEKFQYKNSALSMHIFEQHQPSLRIYNEQKTRANIVGLNRNKPVN